MCKNIWNVENVSGDWTSIYFQTELVKIVEIFSAKYSLKFPLGRVLSAKYENSPIMALWSESLALITSHNKQCIFEHI